MATKKPSSFSSSTKKVEQLPLAPILVGSIIEKGFSSSSSSSSAVKPPNPTVLPFPIARHRSHGGPRSGASLSEEPRFDVDYEAEGENEADYESASWLANPIKRKKKKDLDFSRWRELQQLDENKPQLEKMESKSVKKKVVVAPETENVARNGEDSRNFAAFSVSSSNAAGGNEREPDILVSDGSEKPTLMDEIEAENLARLSAMSRDEIVEAQVEIMEKMDPGVLEMLKKRTRNKLEKKKGSGGQIEGSKRSETGALGGHLMMRSETSGNNKSWKFWSESVEKVRELRFALDGSVVVAGNDHDQSNGNKLDSDQYNVENVAERDFLRTEGDPAAVGYTIKEAVALIRSVVPGQRVLALHLLASVFTKTICNMQGKDGGHRMGKFNSVDKLNWQAVWAFALGPEPEMALSLRIALDDNHDSVVLACAKVIQCILSCDINESFFNVTEKVPGSEIYVCTAPVFRRKPEIDDGFLHGGFWKYNTKPLNILPSNNVMVDEENEGGHTIQDDVVVAGQDVAAGFIRMGILPRICYLLEMEPHAALKECLLSIFVALARHSPATASAIIRCPRLIETVIKMYTKHGTTEFPVQIKAIILLKVLSQSDKQFCSDFVRRGLFQQAMWQWYRSAYTLEHWIKSGREQCKLTSNLMVEQLRLWRVCLSYGYCITYFADFFPAMCLWLSVPAFDKLSENSLLAEFASITREAYLVLGALAQRLPILHSVDQLKKQAMDTYDVNLEAWSWSHVIPMVDLAMGWLSLKNIPFVSSVIGCNKRSMDALDPSASSSTWVISAVVHMLASIFDRIAPVRTNEIHTKSTQLPWLPEFVPQIGLAVIRNGFLNFLVPTNLNPINFPTGCGSLVDGLCYLRQQSDLDTSLSSVSCLHGLVRLAFSIDRCIEGARNVSFSHPLEVGRSERAEKILEEGLIKGAKNDFMGILSVFMNMISEEWYLVQSAETFGRGGPAPGIGFGWGASKGGYWSLYVFLAQMDAHLIIELFEFLSTMIKEDLTFVEGMITSESATAGMALASQRIASVLAVCLIAGPRDRGTLEKALDVLLQAPVLKYLSVRIHSFLQSTTGRKSFEWQYKEADYNLFSEVLKSHFRKRWIHIKNKSSGKEDKDGNNHEKARKSYILETIHEDQEILEVSKCSDCSSLLIEWAHQRLPLPVHWFLSAICSIGATKSTSTFIPTDVRDVARSGLFLLLGLESTSHILSSDFKHSPVSSVSLVWKLHALSMALHANMDVLDDEKSRDVFEALQELYGKHLDKSRHRDIEQPDENRETGSIEFLNFQTQIHGSYTTFVENLVEQFGAISYGDIIFGRQVGLFLHQSVERPVRLAAWNALSNARVLELLPPLEKCLGEPEGYLMPVEEDEGILEAYVKSWSSGALDRSTTRESISFTLALHHSSSFVFNPNACENSSLQRKLARSLLRSFLQKQHQEGMLLRFLRYKLPSPDEPLYKTESARRIKLLKEACEGNSSLLSVVDMLKSAILSSNLACERPL